MNVLGKEIDKKFLVSNAPLIVIGYVLNKVSFLYRTTEGDSTAKMQALTLRFKDAFKPPFPSFHAVDLLVGIATALILKLYLSEKKKNAKKFRNGVEYGSARWGTKEDIKPYMSENERDNVILTNTEGLTMKRPSSPKYGRNKNVMVIGGSGSGKTRFFIKPNIMQMHSSYIVTDPKGYFWIGQ